MIKYLEINDSDSTVWFGNNIQVESIFILYKEDKMWKLDCVNTGIILIFKKKKEAIKVKDKLIAWFGQ